MNQNILKAIKNMVTQEVAKAGFDKTRTGTVLRANLDGTYSVRIDNRVYPNIPIITGYYCVQGDIVKVNYPCGNSSQMYIASGRVNMQVSSPYEVGDIFITVNNVNPSTRFGGTWELIENRFLVGAGDLYDINGTGGSADAVVVSHTHPQVAHTHNVGTQSARHTHTINSDTHYHQYGYGQNRAAQGDSRNTAASTTTFDTTYNTTSDTHTHTMQNETQNHTHAVNGGATTTGAASNGVPGTGANLPPYMAVYIWQRTA